MFKLKCYFILGLAMGLFLFQGLAAAQVACNANRTANRLVNAPDVASLQIDRDHIFCGEVSGGRAKGFHSRPAGHNPSTVNTAGAASGSGPASGTYSLRNFDITQGGRTNQKAFSTMFPDACTYNQVLNSIAYAYRTSRRTTFIGPSAPVGGGANYCLDSNGKPFNIRGFTYNPGGGHHIRTAHPY